MTTKPLYFDFAATTPICQPAKEAMIQVMDFGFANYNSTNHELGRQIKGQIEQSRLNILKHLGLDQTHYLVLTSGATESINLVNQGGLKAYRRSLKSMASLATDHKVTLKVMEALSLEIQTQLLSVHSNGMVDFTALQDHLRKGPSFVNICAVNNETGVIQPIEKLVNCIHDHGSLIHIDASQMLGKIPLMHLENVDFMSISAHKFYGPKGIGALIIKNNRRIESIFYGSDQEYGLRPGTLATHQVVGMEKALNYAIDTHLHEESRTLRHHEKIRRFFTSKGAKVNGENTCLLTFNVLLPKPITPMALQTHIAPHIAFSFGSACQTTELAPSHVLKAMGLSPEEASRSIRLSLGLGMSDESINALLACFETIL